MGSATDRAAGGLTPVPSVQDGSDPVPDRERSEVTRSRSARWWQVALGQVLAYVVGEGGQALGAERALFCSEG